MTNIRVYYHVTLINDFIGITKEMMDAMVECGLYDACEGIYIGALGDESELFKLRGLLVQYPKTHIMDFSEDKKLWEFHTLRLLKTDADTLPKFYGIYCHSKGITHIESENEILYRAFWRGYMTDYVIKRWKEGCDILEEGYDIASVNIVPARRSASKRTHGSGNFWIADSDYLKTLPPFSEVNTGDIFESEMWAWSRNPIINILSNKYIEGFPYWNGTYDEVTKR